VVEWLRRRFGAEITWLPFDLHPEYPREGLPLERFKAHYGHRPGEGLADRFAAAGLAYSAPELVPNTMDALRVTELARDRGLHEAVHDRLMDAFWGENRNIGDPDELRELTVGAGLDAAEVDEVLAGDAYRDRVAASTAQAQSLGIDGIPGFVLDERLLVLGAQPPAVFEQAFAQLAAAD
jgi:predicted DsbA family dithiol-disulfide isomerase